MKKVISLALSLVMVLSVFVPLCAQPAFAAEESYEQDGIHYTLHQDGTASVSGCEDYMDTINLYDSVLLNGYKVTDISDSAFSGKLKILSLFIEIPLEKIGDYAFESCSHLKRVELDGADIKSIGKGAFSMCNSLRSVNLKNNLESIGDGAFFFDSDLSSFSFPKNLTSVGEYAFAFSGLSGAIMNNKLKTIPDRLFYSCEGLKNVALPKSLEKIGDYAFARCRKLDVENIPESLDKIGKHAFEECALTSFDFNGSEIGEYAFSSNSGKMESLTFSENLKKVGKLAFNNVTINKAELPDGVKLENGAFAGMNTEEYTLSKSNTGYVADDGVIYTKTQKTLVYFPSAKYMEKTEEDGVVFTMSNTVTKIAPYAFFNCHGITEVKMSSYLATIGESAFEYASELRTVKLPIGVRELKSRTFANDSLTSVDLNSVRKIEDLAFLKNDGKVEIKLPDTLEEFNPNAFLGADVHFTTEKNYKTVDGVLYSADGKTLLSVPKGSEDSFTIPDGVEEVGLRAFANFRNIKTINIPASLKKLGDESVQYYANNDYGYEFLEFKDGVCLIGNATEDVKEYADEHNIGVFLKTPVQNIKSVTLAGKKTAEFTIDGATKSDIVYSSNDDKIASVSDSGVITALKKGKTYITAAVGTTYFKCEVNVTSDSGIEYKGFDDSDYYAVNPSTYANWKKHYIAANSALAEVFDNQGDDAAIGAYQGDSFYREMNGAAAPDSDNNRAGTVTYGEGYENMLLMLNHACNTELGRYTNPDSMLLYSGAKPYAARLITGQQYPTLKGLRASAGKTFSHAQYISTTLSPTVANNFYSVGEGVLMIIYAEKEALNNQPSGLLAGLHPDGEYEQLLATNSKLEVIEAGVRWEEDYWGKEEGSAGARFQRYAKLRLLGGNDKPEKRPAPQIILSSTPKSLYVKQTKAISAQLKNAYDENISFTSSNTKIAKISDEGKITALKKGTATITVSNSETKTSFKLTVKNPKLNKTSVTIKKGKSFTLKVTGKVGKATFKTNKKSVATVSKSGKIKAKKKGKATITVKSNGVTLKCKVKVS